MPRLDNTKRIVKEDFQSEYHELVGKLAYVLNRFMEQTVDVLNGKVDDENLASDIVVSEITVDASGVPTGNNLIKSAVSNPKGTNVIRAINRTNIGTYATNQPFISYEAGPSPNIIKIKKISGLQANNKYELTIRFY